MIDRCARKVIAHSGKRDNERRGSFVRFVDALNAAASWDGVESGIPGFDASTLVVVRLITAKVAVITANIDITTPAIATCLVPFFWLDISKGGSDDTTFAPYKPFMAQLFQNGLRFIYSTLHK
jgi:hypothetical protein